MATQAEARYWPAGLLLGLLLVFWPAGGGRADDTCVFAAAGGAVLPNIMVLLDNGAAMAQVEAHPAYDPAVDFTPAVAQAVDAVTNAGHGNGFFQEAGYIITLAEGTYYLRPVGDDLKPLAGVAGWPAASSDPATRHGTWSINGRTVALPAAASALTDEHGIRDNAGSLRYERNYLNWIFFSPAFPVATAGNGSDLPARSRLYHAKAALFVMARAAANRAKIGVFAFTADSATALIAPAGLAVVTNPPAPDWRDNLLAAGFVDAVNNLPAVDYSPLAAGLARVGGYLADAVSQVVEADCQPQLVILITPGVSSEDGIRAVPAVPQVLADYDADGMGGDDAASLPAGNLAQPIPQGPHGSTYLDDVAHYLYSNDIAGYRPGSQNVRTSVVSLMAGQAARLFLINTANNGHGHPNLYDPAAAGYGRYHYAANSPASLTSQLLAALDDDLFSWTMFAPPVAPAARSTSTGLLYLARFRPGVSSFWPGGVIKPGLSPDGQVIDSQGAAATLANGSLREDCEPFWDTAGWSDPAKANFIANNARNIYTYLGATTALTDAANAFAAANPRFTAPLLGNPAHPVAELINFIRGADVFDEDGDRNTTENRARVAGDVVHSEPVVVDYGRQTRMLYYGANDGMLHAVDDRDGSEAWAFIPSELLPRLKLLADGGAHPYFVDASPRVYIRDVNGNGIIEADGDVNGDGRQDDMNGDGKVDGNDRDRVVLICGEGRGGTGYFGLDVSLPRSPRYLWRLDRGADAAGPVPAPTTVVPELGETWSVPQVGLVKTSDRKSDKGTPVFFVGAGQGVGPATSGRALLAVNVLTGAVVEKFSGVDGMNHDLAATVTVLDTDSNGFMDKVYAGDTGGQLWRFGKFGPFPAADENIHNWTAHRLFIAEATDGHLKSFYSQPSVTLERGYDLVFIGSGDRREPCAANGTGGRESFYAIKDTHGSETRYEADLAELTDPAAPRPDLDDEHTTGWRLQLGADEKVLNQAVAAFKTLYFTSYTPGSDPCRPEGAARLYALQYKTAAPPLDHDGNPVAVGRSVELGRAMASAPTIFIPDAGQARLLFSVGRTFPEAACPEPGPGVLTREITGYAGFIYLWWKEKIDDQ